MALEIIVKQDNYNTVLDIFQDESFEVNYSINTIKDISQSNGTYTKTISLPDTPKNRQVFGYATNLLTNLEFNSTTSFTPVANKYNPNKKLRCNVLEDGINVLEGYIQLTKYLINEYDKSIEAVIYADNTSFYINMGDKLLTDIDFSEYNFIYNLTSITQSWSNDLFSYNKGVYFPLIDYGFAWTINDLSGFSATGSYGLSFKHFRPATYVKTIFDKVFQSNGYNYQSKFLGTNNSANNGATVSYADPRFGGLVIPFSNPNFQTDAMITQNKIFFVGLSASTISQYSTYDVDFYQTKWGPSSAPPTKAIVNARGITAGSLGPVSNNGLKKLWYNGYMLSPFDLPAHTAAKNMYLNNTSPNYIYDSKTIPFTRDTNPLFNTTVGSASTYNLTASYYENLSGDVFKQRFVINTDILTNYSMQYNSENSVPNFTELTLQSYRYIMKVEFFRSKNPITGADDPSWATGTGSRIPGDLGGALGLTTSMAVKDINGNPEKITHWIADINGNSNCFTKDKKIIIPQGAKRYLGEYCTDIRGFTASPPARNGTNRFRFNSGDAVAFYYNDGANQPNTRLQGLWASGVDPVDGLVLRDPYFWRFQAQHQPGYGDWYQNLQLQTIFLDGDDFDPLYGNSGSILPNGNKPILPGEKVRVVFTFGCKYGGQQMQSPSLGTTPTVSNENFTSYKPPMVAYLLTGTDLAGYANGTDVDPKTKFWNDVSPEYINGMAIRFNDIIPQNMKQRDFIQNIVRMHNLYIEPTKLSRIPNTLIIEPRDDYYRISPDVLNWTNKLDISQPIDVKLLAETQYKRTIFTYKEDGDYYNKQYKQNTNETYGQYIYSIDNDFLTDELKIESIFSPTPMSTLYSLSTTGTPILRSGGFVLPVFLSGDNQKSSSNGNNTITNVNYRVLYRKYTKVKNEDKIYIFNGLTDTYPYVGPYDDPYNPTYAVNWGQTRGEFYPVPTDQFFENLVNNYWASLLSELSDMDSRFITCKMFLMADDINNFYFYKQILLTIDGVDGYYKVNSIEGFTPGSNNLCTVTLLRSNSNLPRKVYQGSTNTPRSTSIYLISGGGSSIPTSGGLPTF
jgi:hypothetical protein